MRRAIRIKVGARDAERRIEAAYFAEHQAADPQTGVGARDKEKGGAIGVANADIFNRCRLARRKIGGARAWHRGQHSKARGQNQKNPFEEIRFSGAL
jgi:hypothetical protein